MCGLLHDLAAALGGVKVPGDFRHTLIPPNACEAQFAPCQEFSGTGYQTAVTLLVADAAEHAALLDRHANAAGVQHTKCYRLFHEDRCLLRGGIFHLFSMQIRRCDDVDGVGLLGVEHVAVVCVGLRAKGCGGLPGTRFIQVANCYYFSVFDFLERAIVRLCAASGTDSRHP